MRRRQSAANHGLTCDVLDTVIFVHAYELRVTVLASLLFSLKESRAAG